MGIKYRKLHGYKYELADNYCIDLAILKSLSDWVTGEYFRFSPEGCLWIKRGYAWDGASGPAIDTLTILRGSLVHDVFYQAMRMGLLDPVVWRPIADKILYDICIEDGMLRIRANWVYWAVQTFARRCSTPTGKVEASDVILEAPPSKTGT